MWLNFFRRTCLDPKFFMRAPPPPSPIFFVSILCLFFCHKKHILCQKKTFTAKFDIFDNFWKIHFLCKIELC